MTNSEQSYAYIFYVSPDGNDNASGSLSEPFRSLQRARDAVRAVNTDMSGDIRVCLRGGVYHQDEPLVLDARDSGSNGYQIIYDNYPGETPVLSGGVALSGWQKSGNLRYTCALAHDKHRFRQLYVGQRRATRARTPDRGQHFQILRWDRDNREIVVRRQDIQDWTQFEQVEMVIQQYWSESTVRLHSYTVDGEEARIRLQQPEADILFDRPFAPHREGQYFHFENHLSFADQAGEWHADFSANALHYLPLPGENPEDVEIIAPVTETLLHICGTLDQPVQHITVRGLHFYHTNWLRPSDHGNITAQAGQYNLAADRDNNQYIGRPPAAAYVACAQHVRFERNTFRHIGATALDFHYGTQKCEAAGNVIDDVSGNGIALGIFNHPEDEFHLAYHPADEREISSGDRIVNNVIRRVGQCYYGSVGIGAGYVRDAYIAHNDLRVLPYSGISVGWGWLHVDSASARNRIVHNRIEQAMSLLCDGAGIYTLSKQPDSEISGNWVVDIRPSVWAGSFPIAAIYLDEGSEGFHLFHNASNYSTPRDIHLHQTGENRIANHIPDPAAIKAGAGLHAVYQDLLEQVADIDEGEASTNWR